MTRSKIAAAIIIILMLTMTVSLIFLPTVKAHDPPWSIPTRMFTIVSPNPVGVGQDIYIVMWLNMMPPTAQGAQGDRWTFNYKITDPDGLVTNMGPILSDDTGSAPATYAASKIGNYTFQAIFPGQTLAGANPPHFPQGVPYIGDYFEPSESPPLVVTVQEDPVPDYPFTPLPDRNTYWQAPIQQMNKEWSVLGGNWLVSRSDDSRQSFNPYTRAPNSAHILWTKSLQLGGQAGGAIGNEETGFGKADQYATAFDPAVIIGGILYYNKYTSGVPLPGIVALNLRTGETLWESEGSGMPVTTALALSGQPGAIYNNNTFNRLTRGEVFQLTTPNQYGSNAYLWAINGVQGTLRYDMYDASTGDYLLSLTNAMSGSFTYDEKGALVCYILGGGASWLAFWNSSKVYGMMGGDFGNPGWSWRPQAGQMLDWRTGLQWNVTVPVINEPYAQSISKVVAPGDVGNLYGASPGGVVLASTMSQYGGAPQSSVMDIGYDAMTGQQLWAKNRTFTSPTMLYSSVWTGAPAGNGIFTHFDKSDLVLYAYSLETGDQLWSTKPSVFGEDPLAYYNCIWTMGYGNIYVGSYGGNVYCIDQTTGELEWKWSTGPSGKEVPGNPNWTINVWSGAGVGWTLADGKLYVSTGHAYNPPMFNGARMYCLDAETGDLIYSVRGWWECVAVAYDEMVVFNGYDNAIYAFGKGLSATTVSAPNMAVPQGSAVVLSGTVTDQSTGQTCLGIPAAGTPAIADEYMSDWMAYLYMQQPRPADATGVPVTIDVIDSNGNYRNIGTATSDANGKWAFTWIPDIPGDFKVIATFEGSESYYPSIDEAFFTSAEAPQTNPEPTQAPASLADQYLLPATGGIIAAIAIVGVAILLMLRKK